MPMLQVTSVLSSLILLRFSICSQSPIQIQTFGALHKDASDEIEVIVHFSISSLGLELRFSERG